MHVKTDEMLKGVRAGRRPAYVDQSSRRLCLTAFDRPIDPTPLLVLAREARSWRHLRLEVELNVIAASHLINVRWRGDHFCELLSCMSHTPPGPIARRPCGRPTGSEIRCRAGALRYAFRMDRLREDDDRSAGARVRGESSDLLVAARFPAAPGGPEPLTAISGTLVEGRPDGPSLVLRSVHWYAQEGIAAVSRSELSLPASAGPAS